MFVSLVKMNFNLLTKTSRQRCGDLVPTITHTNMPDCKFNWQMLLIHCFTAHLEVLVGNSNSTCLSSIITQRPAWLWDPNNSLVKINCYLLNNNWLVGSDVTIFSDSGSYWVEFYSVEYQGWPKTSFLGTPFSLISFYNRNKREAGNFTQTIIGIRYTNNYHQ